jgi:hypothetical protein
MAFLHGKNTVTIINAVDISQYTNQCSMTDETAMHKITCFGASRDSYQTGLGDGSFTIGGYSNDAAGGPRRTVKPLKAAGTSVLFLYRPEGTGSGKAQSSVQVFIKTYNESSPVADNYTWTAELQMSGTLTETLQP